MPEIVAWQRGLPFTFEEWALVVRLKREAGHDPGFGGLDAHSCLGCGYTACVGVFFRDDPTDAWYTVCPVCGQVFCEVPVYVHQGVGE